jgi:hypothetical protein
LAAISANSGAARRWLTVQGNAADGPGTDVLGKVVPILDQLSADALRAGETLNRLRALFEHGSVVVEPMAIDSIVADVPITSLGEGFGLGTTTGYA